jgi:hypothetical protein
LDRPDDLAVDFDDECLLVPDELLLDLPISHDTPPDRDVRLAENRGEASDILDRSLAQADSWAGENHSRTLADEG